MKVIIVADYPNRGQLFLDPRNKVLEKKEYTEEVIKETERISLPQCSNNRQFPHPDDVDRK
jgi:hypothetical protein